MTLPALALTAGMALGSSALAQNPEPVWPKLTPKLQDLLRKEMLSINRASQQIVVAIVEGDDERVANLAQQIHDSYVLRQSMTPEDEAKLVAAVSDDFLRRDRALHQIAAKLAQAARAEDQPLQLDQFRRMIEACSGCHAQYATDRFPKFLD